MFETHKDTLIINITILYQNSIDFENLMKFAASFYNEQVAKYFSTLYPHW